MKFFNNHITLFSSALIFFLYLTLNIAILPALENQKNSKPFPDAKPLTKNELAGKMIYIENGCVACHTQQVRNIDEDKVWGNRPSLSADYAGNKRIDFWRNTATLMGTERTGPDLTNIGERQPSEDWHLLHLYQPRAVVKQSVMPAYQWLFREKDFLDKGDVEVKVPQEFLKHQFKKIVATKEALQLVAYLKSLKQIKLPDGTTAPEFLYKKEEKISAISGNAENLPDGAMLFTANCAACHQESGEGLQGAFPPLKGSPVVTGNNLALYVTIIMKGYSARVPQFGVMPPVGTTANFKPEDVAAIMNHERTSWGNNNKKVTAEEVKKIMDSIK